MVKREIDFLKTVAMPLATVVKVHFPPMTWNKNVMTPLLSKLSGGKTDVVISKVS